jgi:hypothetical protein
VQFAQNFQHDIDVLGLDDGRPAGVALKDFILAGNKPSADVRLVIMIQQFNEQPRRV